MKNKIQPFKAVLPAAAIGAMLAWGPPVQARVATIVIDSPASPAYGGAPVGSAGPYVTLKGRAFGELDPSDPHNQIIQDIDLAPRDAHGKVPYIATFQITMPQTASEANGLMIYEVSEPRQQPDPDDRSLGGSRRHLSRERLAGRFAGALHDPLSLARRSPPPIPAPSRSSRSRWQRTATARPSPVRSMAISRTRPAIRRN